MSGTFEEYPAVQNLSLHGGPLYQLGCRLGLVRGGTNTFALGLSVGVSLWIVVVALGIIEGGTALLCSLESIDAHVRLLLVIPLMFLCESTLDPSMKQFFRTIVRSGIVPGTSLPVLESTIARTRIWKDSWLPETVFALASVLLTLTSPDQALFNVAAADFRVGVQGEFPLTAFWYWSVCLTVFRFLMIRWFWRLCLWWYLLWRVWRLPLQLVPTHPDGAGGMGYLEVVQTEFAALVLANSALLCSTFAREVHAGTMVFEAVYPGVALILAGNAVVFVLPLLFLAPRLWTCRERGLRDFSVLAARYANSFDSKWLGAAAPAEPLLGTPDLQSLSDLHGSFRIVKEMRLAPISLRLLMTFAAAVLLPALPLLLLKYPLVELAKRFLMALAGLEG